MRPLRRRRLPTVRRMSARAARGSATAEGAIAQPARIRREPQAFKTARALRPGAGIVARLEAQRPARVRTQSLGHDWRIHMAKLRTPANVLALTGAFRHNPSRTRQDAEGNRRLNRRRPKHLPAEFGEAWDHIVSRLPKVALFSCDELTIECACMLLTAFRESRDLKVARELRGWLGELGFSPRARTHLVAAPPTKRPGADDPLARVLPLNGQPVPFPDAP